MCQQGELRGHMIDVHGSHKLGIKLPRLVRRMVITPMNIGNVFKKDQSNFCLLLPGAAKSYRERGIRRLIGMRAIEPRTA